MSEAKFTEGPWHVDDYKGVMVFDKNGWAICNAITHHGRHDDGAAQANARFIAIAPELYEALKAQEMADADPEAARRKGYFDRARDMRKAALAKAEGRA